jgi:hypothetical protein
MPFDADYPKDDNDGASAAPTPEPPLWLRCFLAAMIFGAALAVLLGSLWPLVHGLALL